MAWIKSMITAAAVAFVTSAAPIEERLVGGQIANFDDLTTPTVVSLTSLGTYKGLNYSGISLATDRITTLAGVPPQSLPNAVYYSSIGSFTPAGGSPQVAIPTTSYGFFAPTSIYFGCAAGAPVSCTFTVTGSYKNLQTAQQTFQFTPTGDPTPLKLASLTQPGFVGVDKLTFSSVYTVAGIQVPGTTVLDTFVYLIATIDD